MKNLKTIEITISPQGETTLETQGFAGSECQEASRLLEQALGVTTSEQRTAEFYTTHEQQQRLTEGP